MWDPPLSDIDLKIKMAWVWTTLKIHLWLQTSVEMQELRPHAFGADHANDPNIVKGKGFKLLRHSN